MPKSVPFGRGKTSAFYDECAVVDCSIVCALRALPTVVKPIFLLFYGVGENIGVAEMRRLKNIIKVEVVKMYCKNCGEQIDDKAVVCPKCGVPVEGAVYPSEQSNKSVADAPSAGFAVLSFFFPIVGLILWLVWKDATPLKAKSCGKGALIAVIVDAVVAILYVVIVVAALGLFGNVRH